MPMMTPIDVAVAAVRWAAWGGTPSDEHYAFGNWYAATYAPDGDAATEDLPPFPVAWRDWQSKGKP